MTILILQLNNYLVIILSGGPGGKESLVQEVHRI